MVLCGLWRVKCGLGMVSCAVVGQCAIPLDVRGHARADDTHRAVLGAVSELLYRVVWRYCVVWFGVCRVLWCPGGGEYAVPQLLRH